jgi:hypothetical protein
MKFKYLIAIAALIAAIFTAPSASAEVGTESAGITNVIPGAATNAIAGTSIKVANQELVAAQIVTVGAGTNSFSSFYTLERSMDGTTWETTPLISIVMPHTAVVTNVLFTNFTSSQLGAAGYIRVKGVGNTNVANLTNTFTFVKKKVSVDAD